MDRRGARGEMRGHGRHRKQPYPYVTAWGHLQGLRDYSIEAQVPQTVVDGAPKGAIFKDTDGVWHTLAELERQAPRLRAELEAEGGMNNAAPAVPEVAEPLEV
jgi:hypothetical protein